MRAGDVLLFIGGNGIIDDCIRYETSSKYTHAALAINQIEFVEAWASGVRKNTVMGYSNIDVYTPIISLTEEEQALIVRFALSKLGEPYNFAQLAGFIYEKITGTHHNPFGNPHETICSQLVIQAYRDVLKIDLLPGIEAYSLSPGDLALSKLLRKRV